MSLEIYPSDFSTRYGLYAATAIFMSENYNDIGKIQVVEPLDDYAIQSLKVGNIVYNTVRGTTYVIENVQSDTIRRQITANGYTVDYFLNKRCVAVSRKIANIERDTYSLISDNLRGLPRIDLAPIKGLTETFQDDNPQTEDQDESVIYGGQLLDKIKEVLNYGELGRRMTWNPDAFRWTFEIYKGVDKTKGIHSVAFVEEHGTCSDLIINIDESTYKNVAYIRYKIKDQEKLISIGQHEGADREEYWCTAVVVGDSDQPEAEVKKKAERQAALELGKHIKRNNFTVSIDATEFGIRYDLGDIVSCVSNRFGVAFTARVTGWKYELDSNGEKTSIVLGEPTLTALEEMRIKNGN